jgi:hypothetical protein
LTLFFLLIGPNSYSLDRKLPIRCIFLLFNVWSHYDHGVSMSKKLSDLILWPDYNVFTYSKLISHGIQTGFDCKNKSRNRIFLVLY